MKACQASGVCIHWAKDDSCKKGESCRYNHFWKPANNANGSDSAGANRRTKSSAPSRSVPNRGRGGRSSRSSNVFRSRDMDNGIFLLESDGSQDEDLVDYDDFKAYEGMSFSVMEARILSILERMKTDEHWLNYGRDEPPVELVNDILETILR